MKLTHLKLMLARIQHAELKGDYEARNFTIMLLIAEARRQLIPVGFAYDTKQDNPDLEGRRIVVYFELPEVGQVSWHLPEYTTPWDGHTTEEKYDRIRRFIGDES